MDVYENIRAAGLELQKVQHPSGPYAFGVPFGHTLLYTSGTNCRKDGKPLYIGKVGQDVTIEQAQECAEQCILNMLSNLHATFGDLNRIRRVVKILGFVASAEYFYEQPKVLNAASELLIRIFGENGRAARSAVGTVSLPGNIPVEIEILFEIDDNSEN